MPSDALFLTQSMAPNRGPQRLQRSVASERLSFVRKLRKRDLCLKIHTRYRARGALSITSLVLLRMPSGPVPRMLARRATAEPLNCARLEGTRNACTRSVESYSAEASDGRSTRTTLG